MAEKMVHDVGAESAAVDEGTQQPSPTKLALDERDHLRILVRVGATKARPAFGVDFGELNYRVLGRLIARHLVVKARAYRYGENRTRTAYWPTLMGRAALLGDGDAKLSSSANADDARNMNQNPPTGRPVG